MENKSLTERQQREKEYYEQFANSFDLSTEIDFAPVDGPLNGNERRPWNSYWATYEISIDLFKKDSRLLDFGSGPGENALRLTKIGYQVDGFDISEKNVEVSKQLFDKYKMSERGTFQTSSAENLAYEDKVFDIIVGVDILHHIDIDKSVREKIALFCNVDPGVLSEIITVCPTLSVAKTPELAFNCGLKLVGLLAPAPGAAPTPGTVQTPSTAAAAEAEVHP